MREVKGTVGEGEICIELSGRIDSNNAHAAEEEIAALTAGKGTCSVIVDAQELEYISSAGLRVLLHLRKTNPDLRIINVKSDVYEILEMTGFTQMMTVEKAYRVISVDGCEVIGEGANGKVYRIDQDNVVKTYKNADALSEIRHEREVARLALVLGVPTAISYDVVRVGDSYGSVFELLEARSFAKILAEEPSKFDWCVEEYVGLLKKIHGIHVPAGKLPSARTKTLEAAKRIVSVLPEGSGEKLVHLVEDVPECETMIHGDYHTKNIVLAGDEVLLIDMDTLSVGHPVFELAQMFNSYIGFSENDPAVVERFQGYPAEIAVAFWNRSLRAYLGTENSTVLEEVESKVRCAAYARLIDWATRHSIADDPVDDALTARWIEELTALLDHVDQLTFSVSGASEEERGELEIEASTENLHRVLAFIERQLDTTDCPARAKMQMSLASEEIFVNIAHYAYGPEKGTATVRVEISEEPVTVTITFTDHGIPYDPLAKRDPDLTLSAEEREAGGLGIFLAKQTMDDIIYEYRNGSNILQLKKNL